MDWAYFSIKSSVGSDFRPTGDGTYELVIIVSLLSLYPIRHAHRILIKSGANSPRQNPPSQSPTPKSAIKTHMLQAISLSRIPLSQACGKS